MSDPQSGGSNSETDPPHQGGCPPFTGPLMPLSPPPTPPTEDDEDNKKKGKAFRKKLGRFMSVFDGAGFTKERLQKAKKVPLAKTLMETGRNVARSISSVGRNINASVKSVTQNILKDAQPRSPQWAVPSFVVVAFMTISVAFDAVQDVVGNIIRGFVEGMMRVACAFSESLQRSHRNKFAATNDYQEIAIGWLILVASIWISIKAFLGRFFKLIRQFLQQLVGKMYGKDAGAVAASAYDIVLFYLLIKFFFSFMTFNCIIFAGTLLTILSFFLKMDDLDCGVWNPGADDHDPECPHSSPDQPGGGGPSDSDPDPPPTPTPTPTPIPTPTPSPPPGGGGQPWTDINVKPPCD